MANQDQLSLMGARCPDDMEDADLDIPRYTISRGADGILQFDPPADDEELAIALSYHFPRPKTLKAKMQAAMRLYLAEGSRSRKSHVEAPTTEFQREGQQQVPGDLAVTNESSSKNPTPLIAWFPNEDINSLSYNPTEFTTTANRSEPSSIENRQMTVPSSSKQASKTPAPLTWDSKTGLVKTKGVKRKYGALEAKQVFENRGNACEHHRRLKSKCDPKKCPRNKLFRAPCSSESQSSSSQGRRGSPPDSGDHEPNLEPRSPSSTQGTNRRSSNAMLSMKEYGPAYNPYQNCSLEPGHSHILRPLDWPGIDMFRSWDWPCISPVIDENDFLPGSSSNPVDNYLRNSVQVHIDGFQMENLGLEEYPPKTPYKPANENDIVCGMGCEIMVDETSSVRWDDLHKIDRLKRKCDAAGPSIDVRGDKDDNDGDDDPSGGHDFSYGGFWGDFERGGPPDDGGAGGAGCASGSGATYSSRQAAHQWMWRLYAIAAFNSASILVRVLGELRKPGSMDADSNDVRSREWMSLAQGEAGRAFAMIQECDRSERPYWDNVNLGTQQVAVY